MTQKAIFHKPKLAWVDFHVAVKKPGRWNSVSLNFSTCVILSKFLKTTLSHTLLRTKDNINYLSEVIVNK